MSRELWFSRLAVAVVAATLLVTAVVAPQTVMAGEPAQFSGVVFEDTNRNLTRDVGEPGVAGVRVSNGKEVVQTDAEGKYTLPRYDEMIVFVTKPADYAVPVNEYNVPQFFYVHRPKGSPDAIKEYAGIAPTGELPASVDFPLFKAEATNNFKAIVMGDTQVTDHIEIGYLRDGAIAELLNTDAAFALAMGDNVNDVLSLYDRYLAVMSQTGVPTYYVPGNHDGNFDAPEEKYFFETFSRYFGPSYYSFDYGQVHFVVLDTVFYEGNKNYHGEIDERQMEWLKNDLSFVPQDSLIVLSMHIPLLSWIDRDKVAKHGVANRDAVYQLVQGRNVIALAGHTHTVENLLPGEEAEGWGAPIQIHQILVGAVCGSWWTGDRDERGLPLSYQRDGAPPGYMIFEFNGNKFATQYKAIGKPLAQQMNISFTSRRGQYLPTGVLSDLPANIITTAELDSTDIVANIWNGSAESKVECQIDDRAPVAATKNNFIADPYALRLQLELEDWLHTTSSTHIWTCPLPTDLETGVHHVTVTTTDRYGHTYQGVKMFEVWATH
ncbi:MAG: calcineurin-like phosphoesterase family protein [Anaerolineae bacterium]|nr:calcineurin-like phosphoesterase family protein [Anaerolineae bacterium]